MMFAAVALASLILAAEPAAPGVHPPQPSAPSPAVTVIKAADPTQATLCKTEIPVGSHLKQRVCLTAYEWAERRAASLRMMDQMVGRGVWP